MTVGCSSVPNVIRSSPPAVPVPAVDEAFHHAVISFRVAERVWVEEEAERAIRATIDGCARVRAARCSVSG